VSAPEIVVLAGTNGAGKSSVGGEALRQAKSDYYDPDEATRRFVEAGYDLREANSLAWSEGKYRLEQAILRRHRFAFETTLGGTTITGLLLKASNVGVPVRMWYVGLTSPDLHIARVRARVARGGHDIPDQTIRERFESSRSNMVCLLPHLAELKVYDNSREADPHEGLMPTPELILHLRQGKIVQVCGLGAVPEWAKPITAAALKLA
jgi:predicted ABC-type ATPase